MLEFVLGHKGALTTKLWKEMTDGGCTGVELDRSVHAGLRSLPQLGWQALGDLGSQGLGELCTG